MLCFSKIFTKVNESTPNCKKELKCQQSINVKDKINILEKRQKHRLIELNDCNKNTLEFVKNLNLPKNNEESMIGKYRRKVKEDETRNLNNWNEYFQK